MTSHKGEARSSLTANAGFRESVHLPANTLDYSATPHEFQAVYLHRRFGLPPSMARLVAELHYGQRAA